MAEILEGDYQGKPMLIMRQSVHDKFPFQFGLRKAQMIVEHIEDIKKFVEKYGKKGSVMKLLPFVLIAWKFLAALPSSSIPLQEAAQTTAPLSIHLRA